MPPLPNRSFLTLFFGLATALCNLVLTAADGLAQEPRPAVAERITAAVEAGYRAYHAQDYGTSVARYAEALALGHDDASIAYNAACSAALAGQSDRAFGFLDLAVGLGWIKSAHLQKDGDLESLHDDPRWARTVARATAAERSVATRWGSQVFRTPYRQNLSTSDKAAGLAKLWSEVKFNFVHFAQVPDLDWDVAYMAALPEALATESTHDYYRVLQRLVARLDDAHTNVYLPRALGAMERTPGITTRLIEDRVIVVRVDGGGAADAGLKVGMEITAVGGVEVKAYAAEHVAPFVCASSPQDRISRTYGSQLLRGPLRERVRLKVRDTAGSESELEVPRESRMAVGMRRFSQPAFRFEVLAGNIGYVRLDSFGSEKVREQFVAAFDKIRATDALVIDLRHNGGGNSRVGLEIMAHLTKEPFATLRWHTLQYRPTMRAWGRQPVTRYARGPSRFAYDAAAIYDRPVAMLIGPETFSAAEDMAAVFDQLERGPLIGEATGGSSGQPLMFDLPGGGKARVCTKHDFYADGTEFIGVGIQPDIVVKPSITDVRAGVDTVLQAAIRRLQEDRK